jgi:hypothetical protein
MIIGTGFVTHDSYRLIKYGNLKLDPLLKILSIFAEDQIVS